MDLTRVYLLLSHSGWGLVPVATAICFGIVAYRLQYNWRATRSWPTLLALIAGWLLLLLSAWLCLASLLHFGCAAMKGRQVQCISNVKKLSTGMMMYVQDHDERFPPAGQWNRLLQPYQKEKLICPEASTGAGYGMNRAMSAVSQNTVEFPAETVSLFEAEELVGGFTDQKRTRHSGGSTIGYADGHAKWVNPQTELRWSVGLAW